MQIPDNIRKCACFIGSEKDGKEVFGGTGFFFDVELGSSMIFPCVVTARHNIEALRKQGVKTVLVRFANSDDDRTEVAKTDIDAWFSHPTDPYVDVAVTKIPDGMVNFVGFGEEMALTPERIIGEPIGPGDEVFFPGLFREHYGAEKHIPIMRAGNIAAMPEEQVRVKIFGDKVLIDAFLIEARSIGGLSGSPAFVYVGMHRHRQKVKDGIRRDVIVTKPNRFYFMGLVHGHYEFPEDGEDKRINSGIAIVVPYFKVLEVAKHVAENHPYAPRKKK